MSTDVNRSAARTATLVAVPAALVVIGASLWAFGGGTPTPAPTTPAPAATAPVSMVAPALAEADAAVCRAVVAKLPDAVRDARRRLVTAGAEQNAAYGEPPITLACGSNPPPSLAPTDDVSLLNGVCWYGRPSGTGSTWITLDRRVTITVVVPGPRDGAAQTVIPFSPAIAAADPAITAVPTGCKP